MKRIMRLLTMAAIVLSSKLSFAQAIPSLDNTLVVKLKDGDVVVQLFPEKAPEHVKRIKELAKEGFYDGLVFHRVIDGFMAQTGDPTGTGSGRSKKPNLNAEFNDVKHVRGVVSMARSSDPNSANSQFFIMLADAPHLDGQYTAFGQVIKGMEAVDKIKKGDARNNGKVDNPDRILSMKVASDVPGFKLDMPSQVQTAAPANNAATQPIAGQQPQASGVAVPQNGTTVSAPTAPAVPQAASGQNK